MANLHSRLCRLLVQAFLKRKKTPFEAKATFNVHFASKESFFFLFLPVKGIQEKKYGHNIMLEVLLFCLVQCPTSVFNLSLMEASSPHKSQLCVCFQVRFQNRIRGKVNHQTFKVLILSSFSLFCTSSGFF